MGAKSDQVKGKAKEVVGSTIGSEAPDVPGPGAGMAGEMKEKAGEIADKVEGVIDQVKESQRKKK